MNPVPIALGFKEVESAREIDARSLLVRNWVRLKCVYGCSLYNSSLSCPPHTPDIEECRKILSEYNKALLIRFNTSERSRLEDVMLGIEKKFMEAGKYKAFSFFASPCSACKDCSPQKCKSPERARPTAEAFGIDLIDAAKKAGMKKTKGFRPIGLILIE